MTFLFCFLWLLIFTKLLLFWLWLWQIKEYHRGRFKAHFETQKIKKIISSFWRLKYPKFTKKIIFIFSTSLLLEILLILYFSPVWVVVLTIFLIPLLILSFQIPAVLWRKIIIGKARAKRAEFKNLLVIGITGSYGKTSTKEFLAAILSERFNVLKTEEHINAEIGIAQTILNKLNENHQIFICEIGAYDKGKVKEVCEIIKPKIGILTGINEQHLSTFGSQENIIKTKYELIESLPTTGIAFFNAKNKYCLELFNKTKIKKYLYGRDAAFYGEENILGAMAVARELGMTEEEIFKAVEKIENKFGGIQIKKGVNGLNIIDATYSANPDSVLAHLEYLKIWQGKKVIVMPCLIELGKASKEVHRRIGKKIAEVCDLAIITTKDYFEDIKHGAKLAGVRPLSTEILFLENPKEIFKKIKSFCLLSESFLPAEARRAKAGAKESKEGDMVILESRVPQELINLLKV